MSVFIPNLMLEDVTCINETLLKEHNIKGLILDVDNTLAKHGSQELASHISDWLEEMKKLDVKLMVVSNNNKKRVEPFAKKLGLDFVSMALKPMTYGFGKAKTIFNFENNEIAVVGDQIYTDITGGNLKGMFTILVTPFSLENNFFFKLKRKLENIHINTYKKRNGVK
ncbi:MAG: YqeG family HAD IIIA-type phosphatase [Oscillospiraceae bacterium]